MASRPRATLVGSIAALSAFVLTQAAFSAPSSDGAAAPAPAPATGSLPPPRPLPLLPPADRPRSGFSAARVGRPVPLRTRPGGPVRARLGPRTEFGSARVLSVAAERGRWLGVLTSERPNGKLAWVERDLPGLRLSRLATSLHADLSRRTVALRRGGRVLKRLRVAVGRPGSRTPTGRFAVTDKLRGARFGSYYGCCILALSGHQPNTPPGWRGGNRLAIHGTNSPGTIGAAASAGCLRASDRDLKVLMRRVPLGTPVFIRR